MITNKNSKNNYLRQLSVILIISVIPSIVMANTSESIRATFSDFPSLHPLIVHFAIVLLIVGAIIQLFNIYFLKRELAWISFAMITIGVITAYLAGRYFHPHTHGLSEQAKLVLQQHDFWADWTIYLGFSGVILQGTNFFFMKRKRWVVAIVAVVLAGSGFAVSQAGHYGAQLVHIEGVGPQGDFLESDKNEHEH